MQDKWAAAIVQISKLYMEGGDFVGAAGAAAGELYGYGHGEVLFKPTKCAEVQVRLALPRQRWPPFKYLRSLTSPVPALTPARPLSSVSRISRLSIGI